MAQLIYLLFTYVSYSQSADVLKELLKQTKIVILFNLVTQCFILNIVNYNNVIKKRPQDYVPRVVNNLMIYSFFISSKTIFALFLGTVSFAFDLSDPRKMCFWSHRCLLSCFSLIYCTLLLKGQNKKSKIYSQNAHDSDSRPCPQNFSLVYHTNQLSSICLSCLVCTCA